MSQSGNRLGLTFAVLGAVGFSFKAILIKLAYPYGVDAVTLLALRMLMALPMFVLIPAMLRAGFGFWISLGAGCLLTFGLYLMTMRALH